MEAFGCNFQSVLGSSYFLKKPPSLAFPLRHLLFLSSRNRSSTVTLSMSALTAQNTVFLQHLAWEATNHTTLLPTHADSASTMKSSPGMILFPSCSDKEQLSRIITGSNTAFALTGSAALGQLGPTIGLMDIGESDDAYLFRVALPGVKRDAQEFTCNVESDGKVLIRGVTTTGERTVCRFSQVFEMQTENLCPPGHFSITFHLPGPVDPQHLFGNFGMDGVLEGIVMKENQTAL